MISPEGGDVKDSVECILRNFVEMNRLWIRMQNGKSRNLEQREQQRKDLKVLVGTNFVVLSQLEGIDAEYYSKVRLLEEIKSHRKFFIVSLMKSIVVMILLRKST